MAPSHSLVHLAAGAGVWLTVLGLMAVVRNRVIRRRLLFSFAAGLVAAGVHVAASIAPAGGLLAAYGWHAERILLALAAANALVSLAFNPWFRDGESDRAPAIVQDALVAAAVILAGVLVFDVSSFSFLTGSAIVAAIAGFALQETLGNAFAGIAIQIERPFKVGHWIAVGEHVGLVTEVTWRATKIRTKAGNQVSLPNSLVAGQPINNYSEPAAPTRLQIDVGADYGAAPNGVRAALLAAANGAPNVLASPAPAAILLDFGASAIMYRLWIWVDDYSRDDQTMDAVRTRIYYEFKRQGIEIPWPIQIEYQRSEVPVDLEARRARIAESLARVPILAALPADANRALAEDARELLFADGEAIVREGDPGGSMFVVDRGEVVLTAGPGAREIAVTTAGGHFGEMALLTGDPRAATVRARGDVSVLEITADAFRAYVRSRPDVFDALVALAVERRRELDARRAAAGAAPAPAGPSLRERMRQYFGL